METQEKNKKEEKGGKNPKKETIYERLSRIAAEAAKNPSKIQKEDSLGSKKKGPKKDFQHEKELSLHSYYNSVLEKQ